MPSKKTFENSICKVLGIQASDFIRAPNHREKRVTMKLKDIEMLNK